MMIYSETRGFNVLGDWGAHGITEWLNFDADRYKKMISIAKERFPGMNTARIWLSFDAYIADRDKYLMAVQSATDILTEAGLNIIPTYYNGWHGNPDFGGYTSANVRENNLPIYVRCTKDTTEILKDANILMFDVSNEPFNTTQGDLKAYDTISRFLEVMSQTIREKDSRPITIGTQCYPPYPSDRRVCDVDRVAPLVDVFSLHPYNIYGLSQPEYEKIFTSVLDYIKPFGKPYLITECVWGAPTADGRKKYLESELETFHKYNVGFICHALFTCPVADLYPLEDLGCTEGLYMAFLDKEFNIRPHHDIFNRYAK